MPDPGQLDPLQAALAAQPMPPPIMPAQQQAPAMPPPDINLGGGGDQNAQPAPPIANTQAPQPQQQPAIPKQSNVPALLGFMKEMFGGQNERGYYPAPSGQPGRPVSRLSDFENFVGNVLQSFSAGMANAGQGPAAPGRGFGAAVQGPYQYQLGQYQLAQAQQAQQSTLGLQQSEAQRNLAQTQMVQTPGGMMPIALAEKFYPALLQSQARIQAAGMNRFAASPFGIYDRQTGQFSGGQTGGGIGATVKVTPELAQELGEGWDQLVGKPVTLQTLSAAVRARNTGMGVAQGSEGAFLFDKAKAEASGGKQGITPLGQGSPAANVIARSKFDIGSAKDARSVETNQNQVNLAINRLQNLRNNADVLTNMIDAGKIDLSMGGDGIIRATIGRNANLTDREKQFAADFQAMSEDINLLRLPQGGGGFRSEEAFEAMQAQRGRLYQNPGVFTKVLDNTLDSMRGVQTANQNALNAFYAANPKLRPGAGGANPPKPSGQDKIGSLVDKYK